LIPYENHNIIDGLRGSVTEVFLDIYLVIVKTIGVQDRFGQMGKLPYLKRPIVLKQKIL
jgi:transketolase